MRRSCCNVSAGSASFQANLRRFVQVISLVVSGIMLGLQFGGLLTLPALFPKMTKWRATARPLRAAAELGTELRHASGQVSLTEEE